MEWRHTVWPEAQLVYTSIAKVANTSIKSALLSTYAPDLERLAPHEADMPYITVRGGRVRAEYPTFCHFAAVRNPFDRLVSFWADKMVKAKGLNDRLTRLGFSQEMTFAQTARQVASIPDDRADPHFRSQSWLITDRNGELIVDLLLRFERMRADWDLLRSLVSSRTGSQLQPLPIRRASKHRHFSEYYNDEGDLAALVAARYATDLRLLAYPVDPEAEPVARPVPADLRAAIASMPTPKVLDLTPPTEELVSLVESVGGQYMGSAQRSPIGHVVTPAALREGRIAESMFDVLVVPKGSRAWRAVVRDLADRFHASHRVVVRTRVRRHRQDRGSAGALARFATAPRATLDDLAATARRRLPTSVVRRLAAVRRVGRRAVSAARPRG